MTRFLHYVVLFSAYAMFWFLALLCLLPIGLGSHHDPVTGAPLNPMLGKKAIVASGIAAGLWLIFYAVIYLGWLEL